MIINEITKQIQAQSAHPHDNWMGAGWLLVPYELEDKAVSLSPFIIITQDQQGNVIDIEDDTAARQKWEAEEQALLEGQNTEV